MHRWADVRAIFVAAVHAETPPGLVRMCQALSLTFIGKVRRMCTGLHACFLRHVSSRAGENVSDVVLDIRR